jgi:hypothetical protein
LQCGTQLNLNLVNPKIGQRRKSDARRRAGDSRARAREIKMAGTKSLIAALVFSASVGTVAAQDGTNAIPADAAKKAIEYCTKIAPSFSAHASCMRMQKETYDKMSPSYTNGTVAYDPGDEARKARLRAGSGNRDAAVDLCPPPHKMTRDGCQ